MRFALSDLELEHLVVVYPRSRRYLLAEQVEAVPLATLATPEALFGSGTLTNHER